MVINIINERKEWFCLEETDISSLKYVIEEWRREMFGTL
jgi:hypothetical protein